LKRKRSVISADGSMIAGSSGSERASAKCPIPSPGYEGDVGGVPSASDEPSVLGDESHRSRASEQFSWTMGRSCDTTNEEDRRYETKTRT
jgi:hypothetical protein